MIVLHRLCFILAFVAMTAPVGAACNTEAVRDWGKAMINANSLGDDCTKSVLVVTIRDAKGNPLWTSAHRRTDLMTFQELPDKTEKGMATQLQSWIAADKRMSSSADLPDWPQSAQEASLPPNAEFPFRVDEGLDRENYIKLRHAKLPLFCFVTGMESQTCIVLDGDTVTPVGTQSFPG